MNRGLGVDPEVLGLRFLGRVDVDLEHRGELGPQRHVDSVVVEIEHWDLVSQLHYALELLVQLDAQQHRVDVKTSRVTGT